MTTRNQQILSLYREGVSKAVIRRTFKISHDVLDNIIDRIIVRIDPAYTRLVQVVDINTDKPLPDNVIIWKDAAEPVGVRGDMIKWED